MAGSKTPEKTSLLQRINTKRLDFLGSELHLNYSPKGRFQTNLGGLISLLVTLFMGAVVLTSLKNLMSTDSPVTSVSTVYSRKAPMFDLFKERIFFHFGFRNKGKIYLAEKELSEINRFITIKGFIYSEYIDLETGQTDSKYLLDLDYKPCNQIKDKTAIEDMRWHPRSLGILSSFGFCPDLEGGKEKYFVKSKTQEPPIYTLQIYYFPCSLPNPDDCASYSEFADAELLHTNIKKAFDASNYKKPLSTIVEFDGYQQLEPEFSKMMWYKVRDKEVWDDTQDFFEKRLRVKSAEFFLDYKDSRIRDPNQLHCDPEVLNTPQQTKCKPFYKIQLSSSGEKHLIVRTYPKFFMTLGEIAGTAEIVVLFAVLVYSRYNGYFLTRMIKEEVFGVYSLSDFKKKFNFGSGRQKEIKGSYRKLETSRRQNRIRARTENPFLGQQSNQINKKVTKLGDLRLGSCGQINGLLKQQIKENLSGINLFRSLNQLKILTEIFFKPRHEKLLPMVLLNILDRKNKRKEKETKSYRRGIESNNNRARRQVKGVDDLTEEEAYREMLKNEPRTEIERIIDDFMINNLPIEPSSGSTRNNDNPNLLEKGAKMQLPDEINAPSDPNSRDYSRSNPKKGSPRPPRAPNRSVSVMSKFNEFSKRTKSRASKEKIRSFGASQVLKNQSRRIKLRGRLKRGKELRLERRGRGGSSKEFLDFEGIDGQESSRKLNQNRMMTTLQ